CSARTAAWGRRSSGSGPPLGHDASIPTRTPAPRRTPGTPDGGTPPPVRLPRTHRPAAGTAIPWPRATPPRISPRDRAQTTARRDPSRSNGNAQDHGLRGHSKADTSPNSTAEDPGRMLRKSGRQQVGVAGGFGRGEKARFPAAADHQGI